MRTVPIGIQLLMGQHAYEWNEMMAMSIIGTVPIVFLYLFAQKVFSSRLNFRFGKILIMNRILLGFSNNIDHEIFWDQKFSMN